MGRQKLIVNPIDLILFMRIFLFLLILPFLRRTMSIEQLLKFSFSKNKKILGLEEREYHAKKIIAFTKFLLRRNFLMFRFSCLKQSLAYFKFFSEIGLKPRIHFGIQNKSETFIGSGHAWISANRKFFPPEFAGKKFLRIYSFP